MLTVFLIVVGVLVLAFGIVLMMRSRRLNQSGVTSFRRHIDALSPEARREVHDRVKAQRDKKEGR